MNHRQLTSGDSNATPNTSVDSVAEQIQRVLLAAPYSAAATATLYCAFNDKAVEPPVTPSIIFAGLYMTNLQNLRNFYDTFAEVKPQTM